MKKKISIIGGGPAAMLLAANLDTTIYDVTIYERNKTLGRKFLVAGKGGFNLTHGEDIQAMKQRYTPLGVLDKALDSFDNSTLRSYFEGIGIETYAGSSNRIFPIKGIKPIEVLQAILKGLDAKDVELMTQHTWMGFNDENTLSFENSEGEKISVKSDMYIYALGGGSWSKTGSQGEWLDYFEKKKVTVLPFQASNCAFGVDWPKGFIESNEGEPLKNIALSVGNKRKKGELVITAFGLEGSPVYALSPLLRKGLSEGNAHVILDLKPTLKKEVILQKLSKEQGRLSWSAFIKKTLKLSRTQMQLLKAFVNKEQFNNTKLLAEAIKHIIIPITDIAPIEEAISTVGGISLDAISDSYELKALPNHYVLGEMLDWDAPTGGYLLQACMSMGVDLAIMINKKE